jgi:pyridoxine 4-dehydrogenase
VGSVDISVAGGWQLGDLPVHRVGFGAMRLTGKAAFGSGAPRNRSSSVAVLRQAVDLGINHIDTAAFYFSPTLSANQLINTALAPYPSSLVIVTKVGPGRDPWGDWYTAEPSQLRGQVEENLRQLGRDYLDVVNLRRMPSMSSISSHFEALAALRDEGLIRHLGISNVSVTHLDEAALIAPVVCVQNSYGLDNRASDPVLQACGERGIAFVPFFAVTGSQREGGGVALSSRVSEVASRHGATPAQVRLAWTLHQGPHVLAIPGTGDLGHLAENVAAGALHLTSEDLALLDLPN